jgi:hypothetical protein
MFRAKIILALGLLLMAAGFTAYTSTARAAQTISLPEQFQTGSVNVPSTQSCGTPTIQYAYANPATIYPGQVTTLYWGSVLGAQAAYLQYPNGNRQGIGTPGSQQVNPTQTTTYYIIGVCGSNEAQWPITVIVQGGPTCSGTPQLNGFTASPSSIAPGQGSTLSWGPVNNADYVQLSSQTNGGSGVPAPGSMVVYPNQTTTYYLTAWCQGNSAQAQVTITVNNAPPPTPPPPTNANQITELTVEKVGSKQFKLTIKYFWNGEDSPASIQSTGSNANGQVVTDRPTTGILAGYYKYVLQTLNNIGANGAVTSVTSCMVGNSGTDLVCKTVPVQ